MRGNAPYREHCSLAPTVWLRPAMRSSPWSSRRYPSTQPAQGCDHALRTATRALWPPDLGPVLFARQTTSGSSGEFLTVGTVPDSRPSRHRSCLAVLDRSPSDLPEHFLGCA